MPESPATLIVLGCQIAHHERLSIASECSIACPIETQQTLVAQREDTRGMADSGERTRLLENGHEEAKEETKSAIREFGLLCARAAPVSAAYALQNSLQTGSILVVGRLGPDELSAAAQSYMLAMLAFCIGHGGSSAIDSLAAVHYTTPNADRRLIGILLQRCCLVLFVLYIPWAIAFFFATPILLTLGQPESLAVNVQSFLRILAFGIPGYIWFESTKKLYQAAGE